MSERPDPSAPRFEFRGINHLALVCRDMARTVDFYTNVLGMPLVKTIELPAGMGQHFFFDCGGGDALAFFWFPDAPRRHRASRADGAARPGQPHQRHGLDEPRGLRRPARADRRVPGPPAGRRGGLHRRRQPRRQRVGHQRRPASRCLHPLDLLPGSRRHPAGVRLLDPRAQPGGRRSSSRPGPSTAATA